MATWAIGDVQGCNAPLQSLLANCAFNPETDRLWFVGDLVNRGPDSLGELRFVMGLGERAETVLGNHDLHLLARAAGGRPSKRDSLDALLAAPDRKALLDWLRHRPLLHAEDGWVLTHAGVSPDWTLAEAEAASREVGQALQAPDHVDFLAEMYGNEPAKWSPRLTGIERLRYAVNAFTRMRYCHPDGTLELDAKGQPGTTPSLLLPWFALPSRRPLDAEVVFGHWSTLGVVHWPEHRVWGLDTGAVWGGRLTALDLETRTLTSVDCARYRTPGAPEGD